MTDRRNRPGIRQQVILLNNFLPLKEWCQWDIESPSEGPFGLQEYLQALLRKDPHDITKLMTVPEGFDPWAWRYEHLRFLSV